MTGRSLEQRQIDALKDWLFLQHWTIREAACLLYGVLPPNRMGDSAAFGAWLPGRKPPWEDAREGWDPFVGAEINHIETLLNNAKPLKGHAPRDYLALGARLGIIPPWGAVAERDSECRDFLPQEFLSAPPTSPQGDPQAAGGRHRSDDEIKAIYVVAILHEEKRAKTQILRRLEALQLPGRRDAVGRWLKEIEKIGVEAFLARTGKSGDELQDLRSEAEEMLRKVR